VYSSQDFFPYNFISGTGGHRSKDTYSPIYSMQANKRLIKDIQTMISDEMSSMGVYYSYEDANIKRGTALIFGPEDTPYEFCPLFFSVAIPNDYPFTSPVVLMISSDGKTRFHPNLYVNGKVCLSILGTYTGPSWASTLNIGSVFKSIVSLLDKNPIVNEPGWESYTLESAFAREYSEWVEYHLLEMIVVEYGQFKIGTNPSWKLFQEVFEKVWTDRWSRIKKKIASRAETVGSKTYKKIPYGMGGEVNWNTLLERAESLDKI
jgi:ubiquitin-protein ligase